MAKTNTPDADSFELPGELAHTAVIDVPPLTADQIAHVRANTSAIASANEQVVQLPASRERSLALTALDEALMWANRAALNPVDPA